MAGRFPVGVSSVAAVLALAALVLTFLFGAFPSTNTAHAVTYKMTTGSVLACDADNDGDVSCTLGSNAKALKETADIKLSFTIPQDSNYPTFPNYSNFNKINMFQSPSTFYNAPDQAIPDGAKVGEVTTLVSLSLLSNSGCRSGAVGQPPPIAVTVPLYDCSADNNPQNLIPWIGDGDNLLDDMGNGLPAGCVGYPEFLDEMFDGERARARYFGYTLALASAGVTRTHVNFVVFNPEQLTNLPAPEADMGDSLGLANYIIMNNPGQGQTPNSITEFCSAFVSNTTLLGMTQGRGEAIPIKGIGEASALCAGAQRGVDNDGDGVADDGCWIVTDDCNGGDEDGDTVADELCDLKRGRNPVSATSGVGGTGTHLGGIYTQSFRDADGDTIPNIEDTCPYKADVGGLAVIDADNDMLFSSCDPDSGTQNQDQDDDGFQNENDDCPLINDNECGKSDFTQTCVPARIAECNETEAYCAANDCDDDGDTVVNDGCPTSKESAEDPLDCEDAIDNDGDGKINDGCTVIGSLDKDIPFDTAAPDGGSQFDNIGDACEPDFDGDGSTADDLITTVVTAETNCNDNIDDDADTTADDGCNGSPTFPNGEFIKMLMRSAVCVGGTDLDNDGWCDNLESAWGVAYPYAGTPEHYSLDFPLDPPAMVCSDYPSYDTALDGPDTSYIANYGVGAGVDNDLDGQANANDTNCTCPGTDLDCDGVADTGDNCPGTAPGLDTNPANRHRRRRYRRCLRHRRRRRRQDRRR